MTIKKIHKTYAILENEVGILSILCLNCLHEEDRIIYRTTWCKKCKNDFKQGDIEAYSKYEVNYILWQVKQIKKFANELDRELEDDKLVYEATKIINQ